MIEKRSINCPYCHKEVSVNVNKKEKTIKGFGYEWTKWGDINKLYRNLEELEWEFNRYGIPRSFFKDKVILDAGCGMGRYTYLAAKYSAKKVYGIDPGEGILNAKKLEDKFDNIYIEKGNIFDLPYKNEYFDSIMSIGVLHHTGDTEKSFQCLLKKLKQNGKIFVMLYDYPKGIRKSWYKITRPICLKMNHKLLYFICYLFCLIKFIPRLIKYLITHYKIQKFERNVADTFDWYCCEYQDFMTKKEIIKMFERNGLKEIQITNPNYPSSGNVVIGTKR